MMLNDGFELYMDINKTYIYSKLSDIINMSSIKIIYHKNFMALNSIKILRVIELKNRCCFFTSF
jgi:hypothetical protein